jgi:hypothetical protein
MPLQFVTPKRVSSQSLSFLCWTATVLLILGSSRQAWSQAPAPDNLLADANKFDQGKLVDNPWGGVVNGILSLPAGTQRAVNDNGGLFWANPGPDVAVGDLNGDDVPDIVAADTRGFFWYFPNSGTVTAPKFTYGEVMPIWIGNAQPDEPTGMRFHVDESEINTIPRFSLVDFDKSGKLDIVAGNYEGKLFYIANRGSSRQAAFRMPQDLSTIQVPTYSENRLWCNFLAPCLYDWRGNNIMDLIMGEGTYASNSIYLLTNKGTNDSPTFNEANTVKIIPGQGREHLTPQVVDWNNDGKPDIITGERLGFIDLFLNTTTDPSHPQFDAGQHVKFGGKELVGPFTTVAVGDLYGNKLPNLVLSTSSNQILYATNKGTLGNPQFDQPLPVLGKNPLPKILPATNWNVVKALGIPYINLVCVNDQIEPDFKGPTPEIKSALKYYAEPHPFNTDFPIGFYPQEDTQIIAFTPKLQANHPETWSGPCVLLKPKTHYTLTFWVKSSGDISNFDFQLHSEEDAPKGVRHNIMITQPITPSDSWTQITDSFDFPLYDDVKLPAGGAFGFYFWLTFNGHATIYLTGFSLTEDH